jgi:hypothetical protein
MNRKLSGSLFAAGYLVLSSAGIYSCFKLNEEIFVAVKTNGPDKQTSVAMAKVNWLGCTIERVDIDARARILFTEIYHYQRITSLFIYSRQYLNRPPMPVALMDGTQVTIGDQPASAEEAAHVIGLHKEGYEICYATPPEQKLPVSAAPQWNI